MVLRNRVSKMIKKPAAISIRDIKQSASRENFVIKKNEGLNVPERLSIYSIVKGLWLEQRAMYYCVILKYYLV